MNRQNRLVCLTMIALMLLVGSFACSNKSTDPVIMNDPPSLDSTRSYGSHVSIDIDGNSDYPTFVFGYAPQYAEITHVFWLHNAADDSMNIDRVSPG